MRGRFWAAQLARLPGSVPSRLCAFHIKCSLLGMHAAAARCKTQLKRVKIATPGIAVERIAVPHAASWLFLGSSSVPSTRAVGRAGYGDSFRADFTEVSEGSNPSLPNVLRYALCDTGAAATTSQPRRFCLTVIPNRAPSDKAMTPADCRRLP